MQFWRALVYLMRSETVNRAATAGKNNGLQTHEAMPRGVKTVAKS
jgi:hypothetical protein